ncbi:hypothetical protein AO369_0776 [Moraxella catarrhalis]|nr:hypothetical protein AO369_0776 [Moraxella catarrhalis]
MKLLPPQYLQYPIQFQQHYSQPPLTNLAPIHRIGYIAISRCVSFGYCG